MGSVNGIFNPEFVDRLYPKPSSYRANLIKEAKATNYGVVRLGLIETLFEMMYDQKREIGHDETKWPHRIMGGRKIVSVEEKGDKISLKVRQVLPGDLTLEADGLVEDEAEIMDSSAEEVLDVDLVVAATGYRRTAHIDILKDAWKLLPKVQDGVAESKPRSDQWSVETDGGRRVMEVGRDYKVKFNPGTVASESGIWLQGCCEGTHGVCSVLPYPIPNFSHCFFRLSNSSILQLKQFVTTDIFPAE